MVLSNLGDAVAGVRGRHGELPSRDSGEARGVSQPTGQALEEEALAREVAVVIAGVGAEGGGEGVDHLVRELAGEGGGVELRRKGGGEQLRHARRLG